MSDGARALMLRATGTDCARDEASQRADDKHRGSFHQDEGPGKPPGDAGAWSRKARPGACLPISSLGPGSPAAQVAGRDALGENLA